jgi:peptidoglycan-associated lipoprotein
MSIGKLTAAAALMVGLSACATGGRTLVRSTPTCVNQTVQIYFEPQSSELTREGAAVIGAAARSARGCEVAGVDVLGLADATGAADANLELSKRRAQSVTAALKAAGLPDGQFDVSAAGQAGATTRSGEGRPLRRRVDVVLRLRNN